MTKDQLKVVEQVDELLNEACLPTYSKLQSLLRNEAEASTWRAEEFRAATTPKELP